MENYKLVETFSEFKEFKNIDREAMMRIIEDVFRGMLNKKFDTDTEDFIDIILNTFFKHGSPVNDFLIN